MALPPEHDAYGRLLLAHLEGEPSEEVMERDDGYVYCGDPSDYFAPRRRWPSTERRALRFARGRVLDVGCGAGRVALDLQARGHEIVAIDESPLAVEVARRRGVRRAEPLGLADVDERLGRFDTVLVLRNNLGLAGSDEAARPLLRRLARVTNDHARLITDSVDPARGGERADPARRYRVRFREYASPWFRYLMLAPEEFERLVDGSGWRVLRTITEEKTPRYGVVLEKT